MHDNGAERVQPPVETEHSDMYQIEMQNLQESHYWWTYYFYDRAAQLEKVHDHDIVPGQNDDVAPFMGAALDFTVANQGLFNVNPVSKIIDNLSITEKLFGLKAEPFLVELALALADRDQIDEIKLITGSDDLILTKYYDQISLAVAVSQARTDNRDEAMRLVQTVRMAVGENDSNREGFNNARQALDPCESARLIPKRSW